MSDFLLSAGARLLVLIFLCCTFGTQAAREYIFDNGYSGKVTDTTITISVQFDSCDDWVFPWLGPLSFASRGTSKRYRTNYELFYGNDSELFEAINKIIASNKPTNGLYCYHCILKMMQDKVQDMNVKQKIKAELDRLEAQNYQSSNWNNLNFLQSFSAKFTSVTTVLCCAVIALWWFLSSDELDKAEDNAGERDNVGEANKQKAGMQGR